MDAIWNHMQLERPPNATCCIQREKFDTAGFLNTLDKIIRDLISQETLHKEAAFLSRLLYRMKSKFRNDKGMKAMSKLNRALLNYLSLRLEKEYENLRNYVEFEHKYVKLPTKQMVEYVLVRTQGFAKLMARIEEVSKHAAHFLRSRLMLGHAWFIATIAYSVVSRIWMLSRHLTNRCCIWYNDLYQYLQSFKVSGLSWLPNGFVLPSDLRTWLTLSWIDEPIPDVSSSHGIKNVMFKLITPCDYDSDEDLDLNKHNYSKEIKLKNPSPNLQKENTTCNDITIDTDNDAGEIIDRRSFSLKQIKQTSLKVEKYKKTKIEEDTDSTNVIEESAKTISTNLKKKKRLITELTFTNVKNKSELMLLLDKESYPGLDKLQWNMIRNKGKKQLNKLDASSSKADQSILIKKIIKRITQWVT
ncbi:nucleolus and neural progenitor protein [Augochlora pura]